MKKMEKKKKITIRCRKCFMVDTYEIEKEDEKEQKCRHCGEKIYKIDEV